MDWHEGIYVKKDVKKYDGGAQVKMYSEMKRTREIIARCRGSILDVGCVGSFPENLEEKIQNNVWLYRELEKRFKRVVGIDIAKEEIPKLKKIGYNVQYGNAEDFELNEKFDTIVAGELIEHLSNPGNFLDACRNHLKEDGVVILTTPSAFCFEYFVKKCFGMLQINSEHSAWYDEKTLTQLAERHHFDVVGVKYIIYRYKPSTIKGFVYHRIVFPIVARILHDELTAQTLLVVLQKKRSRSRYV